MPVYEYICGKCGERFEIVSSISGREESAVCPVCASRDVVQAFGGFRVGISRTKLNPGTFERTQGAPPRHKPPSEG